MQEWSHGRRFLFDGAIAGAIGAGVALGEALTGGTRSLVFLGALFAVVVGLPIAALLHQALWPTRRAQMRAHEAEMSVETRWFEKATAESFWTLGFLLVWMDLLGRTWHLVPWLTPLTTIHIGVGASLALGLNYLSIRRREA